MKINPIYQENDSSRNGDSTDTQSDTSVPVGEIQIEMYESLPRHRMVRPSRSAPNLPYLPSTAISSIPDGKEQESDALAEPVERNGQLSGFSHSQSSKDAEDDVNDNQKEDTITLHSREKENVEMDYNASVDRGYRKQLTRQTGVDATSGDPDVIDTVPSPRKTPVPPSAPIISSSSHTQGSSTLKRKGTPRFFKPRNYLRSKQLSAVQEDRSIIEVEDTGENFLTESETTALNDNEENIINDCKIDNREHISCLNDFVTYHADNESCHSMNTTNQQHHGCNKVKSIPDEDITFKENIANKQGSTTDTDLSILSSSEEIIQISRNKDVYYLDKIALVPSYSHIHNTSPVSSIDHINNNNETVPDLMLQHNGTLHGVSRYGPINGLNKQSPVLDGHDYIPRETQELNAIYALSNNSSVDSDNKYLGQEPIVSDCDCGGRPTLKCSCGRKALQNIFKEQYVIKCTDKPARDNNDKSLTEDTTSVSCIGTPAKCYNEKNKQTFDGIIYAHFDGEITEITEAPDKLSPVKVIVRLKSILHKASSPEKSPSNVEHKIVSFSEDTVFNEDKGVVYLKECINPSDLALLISEMENLDDGVENPAFEDITEDVNNFPDKKQSKKRSNKKNKVASNDALALKVMRTVFECLISKSCVEFQFLFK